MHKPRFFLTLFLILSSLATFSPLPSYLHAATERREVVVGHVIDGDTFQLASGERIRLLGIDTPEYQPWKGREDFYGKEASAYTKKLLSGQKVSLESDIEAKDKYGRTLAYVYLSDGTFVNKLLVENGYAEAKYYKPNGLHRLELNEVEKKARSEQKGLWKGKKTRHKS
jgi:micrococcal nuclease